MRELENWKDAEELAKSVLQGKPTPECPLPFSYVQASLVFAKFILREREFDRTVP